MAKMEYATVDMVAAHPGHLTAWIDGKLLGAVFTDGDERVCVRLSGDCLKGMKRPTPSVEDG